MKQQSAGRAEQPAARADRELRTASARRSCSSSDPSRSACPTSARLRAGRIPGRSSSDLNRCVFSSQACRRSVKAELMIVAGM